MRAVRFHGRRAREAYGNTDMQLSSSTRYGARTATSPGSLQHPAGTIREKQDMFKIWRTHNRPLLRGSRRGEQGDRVVSP